jgi:hypothetical protein
VQIEKRATLFFKPEGSCRTRHYSVNHNAFYGGFSIDCVKRPMTNAIEILK